MNGRNQLLESLQMLADLQAQIDYERRVPNANVPAELVCDWFDDLAIEQGTAMLEPGDATLVAEFTRLFEVRLDELPTAGGVAALHASTAWHEIVRAARTTLAALERGG